jgi:hypothetical protein
MKLLDRMALGHVIKMILDFLYRVIKLWGPSPKGEENPKPPKRRWRRKDE